MSANARLEEAGKKVLSFLSRETSTEQQQRILGAVNSDDPALTAIELTGVGEEYLADLFVALLPNTHVRSLHIKKCTLGGPGVDFLSSFLAQSSTLRTLRLSNAGVSDHEANCIAAAMLRNKGVTTLGLDHNRIRDPEPIVQLLTHNRAIEVLDLSFNELGSFSDRMSSATALATAIAKNTRVRELQLMNNGFDDASVLKLCEGIENGAAAGTSALRTLDLTGDSSLKADTKLVLRQQLAAAVVAATLRGRASSAGPDETSEMSGASPSHPGAPSSESPRLETSPRPFDTARSQRSDDAVAAATVAESASIASAAAMQQTQALQAQLTVLREQHQAEVARLQSQVSGHSEGEQKLKKEVAAAAEAAAAAAALIEKMKAEAAEAAAKAEAARDAHQRRVAELEQALGTQRALALSLERRLMAATEAAATDAVRWTEQRTALEAALEESTTKLTSALDLRAAFTDAMGPLRHVPTYTDSSVQCSSVAVQIATGEALTGTGGARGSGGGQPALRLDLKSLTRFEVPATGSSASPGAGARTTDYISSDDESGAGEVAVSRPLPSHLRSGIGGRGFGAMIPKSAWVDDADVDNCHGCKAKFSVVLRKHHCRFCGNVYCDECAPISKFQKVRVCHVCLSMSHSQKWVTDPTSTTTSLR